MNRTGTVVTWCNSVFLDFFVFFNDTATTEIYTLSLHDALPIWQLHGAGTRGPPAAHRGVSTGPKPQPPQPQRTTPSARSEEHTSELQSRQYLVCRLLLEKKKKKNTPMSHHFPLCL